MTEKNDSDQSTPAQEREHPVLRARSEQIESALAVLRALSAFDLAGVLMRELDRRRLDASGNPNEAPGLYNAATTAILGLLGVTPPAGQRELREHDDLVSRLADVGRGVRSGRDGKTAEIREISQFVAASNDQFNAAPIAERSRLAEMLARTFAARFGQEVLATDIETALAAPTHNGRVVKVAFAVGIFSGDVSDPDVWKDAHDTVRKNL